MFVLVEKDDPILHRPVRPVETFDALLHGIVARFFDLLKFHHGLGLAANQVGENMALFVMNLPMRSIGGFQAVHVINPVITSFGNYERVEGIEGCLSLPGERYQVSRYRSISVEYQNMFDEKISETLEGIKAIVFQHEFDHLAGLTIADTGIRVD